MNSKLLVRCFGALACLVFVACGGGGGGGGDRPPPIEPPSGLTYPTTTVAAVVGEAIAPLTPTVTGVVDAWTVHPQLPAGLSLDAATGILSGTPTEPSAVANYAVSATNGGGSDRFVLQIGVTAALVAPTDLAYPETELVITQLSTLAARTPSVNGVVSSWTVTPALPPGITLDPASGALAGTPVDPSPRTVYTIAASNAAGSTEALVAITVEPLVPAPRNLSYGIDLLVGTVGTAIPQRLPSVEGLVRTWSVEPALPDGLYLWPQSGELYGTPQAISPRATYTVTASNESGAAQTTIDVEVLPEAPGWLAYDAAILVGTVGLPIAPATPRVNTVITSWTVAPSLPAGLTIDPVTGVISGTPLVAAAAAEYTVTASNVSGSSQRAIRITVEEAVQPPSNLRYQHAELVVTKDVDWFHNAASVDGRVSSWSIDPTLPHGLAFIETSGYIYGTAFVESPRTAYTVTASNEAGSTQATIYITVNAALAAPIDLRYERAEILAEEGIPLEADRASVLGTVTSWAVDPALPPGLRLSSTTGAISGTPSVASATRTYTVTAGNDAGFAQTTVRIEVRAAGSPPQELAYAPSLILGVQEEEIDPAVPDVLGAVAQWSVSPPLPDGLALSIQGLVFEAPWLSAAGPCLAFDAAGNAYTGGTRIVRIARDGAMTLLAGASERGYADGLGEAARFDGCAGIALDAAGNVFVADAGNYLVRKIAPDGQTSTVAGRRGGYGWEDGRGTTASFYSLLGLAIDGAGNLYVLDGAQTVRKVTPEGVVSTLAGSPHATGSADGQGATARFYNPGGIAADVSGNVYVADTWNNTIRVVSPSGAVRTLAGAAGVQGSGDGTGSGATFARPRALAVDAAGTVYVADTGNDMVRAIAPDGEVKTLAGQMFDFRRINGELASARFSGPYAVAVDAAGRAHVLDTTGPYRTLVRKSGIIHGRPTVPSTASHTVTASNSAGSSQATVEIRIQAADVLTWAGTAGMLGSADGRGADARFVRPTDVAVDAAGNAFVVEELGHKLRRITPSGEVTTLAGADDSGFVDGVGSAARFSHPSGVAVDTAGNVFVADSGNATIRRVAPDGTVTTLAGSPGLTGAVDGVGTDARFNNPSDVAVDPLGTVFVADTGNSAIRAITPDGVVRTLAGMATSSGFQDGTGDGARFFGPRGVAVGPGGVVYVADTWNRVIRRVSPAGVVTTLAGLAGAAGTTDGLGSASRFETPSRLAVDADGNLWVPDEWSCRIRSVTPDGLVSTYAGAWCGHADGARARARFSSPSGIGITPAGELLVADGGNHVIRLVR